jgi:mono/diheme cytochrome c family protein
MRPAPVLLLAASLAACDSGTEDRTSVSSTRVVQRPHQPLPPETVPRGTAARTAALAPPGPTATPDLIGRGRERFLIFCSPCHGVGGSGDGSVVSRGFPAPPSYHQERLRGLSPAEIVTVITRGKGLMSAYADRVPPEDRWAIAHFVKELQMRGETSVPRAEPAAP